MRNIAAATKDVIGAVQAHDALGVATPQDRDRLIAQRHAVQLALLRRWYGFTQTPSVEIELVPGRAQHLAAAGAGQHQQAQRVATVGPALLIAV